jgi:tetratricopeptide (TPR) repeat protein
MTRERLLAATAALLAVLVYLNALGNPFVYDDYAVVLNNPSIRHLDWRWILAGSRRFLVNASYAIDYAIYREWSRGYHLTNLFFHVVNVLLWFRVARRAGSETAFATAALFAVHPLVGASVGYVAARAGLLCAAASLAGLLAFRCALEDRRARWRVLAALAFFAAVAAKESGIVLPLVYLAWDRLFAAEGTRGRLRFHVPLVGVALTAGLVRLIVHLRLEHARGLPGPAHLLGQAWVTLRYLGLLVAPVGQSLRHEVATGLVRGSCAALVLAVFFAVFWLARRRAPWAAFGAAWFALFLLPSALVPLGEPMAEHRVYEAAGGVCLIAGWAFASLPRRLFWPLLAVVLALLSAATVARNRVWSDPVALWREATLAGPADWGARYALGDALRDAGDCASAIDEYRRAIALRPRDARAQQNLGICLATLGRADEAAAAFETAWRLDPRDATAAYDRGLLERDRGRPDEARRWFERALERDPGHAGARRALEGR